MPRPVPQSAPPVERECPPRSCSGRPRNKKRPTRRLGSAPSEQPRVQAQALRVASVAAPRTIQMYHKNMLKRFYCPQPSVCACYGSYGAIFEDQHMYDFESSISVRVGTSVVENGYRM
mmetsp:Transcript_11521/g.22011  ORF Transcript_11521/g.22011 Transcript_11521/m.22011 type:complete len:118 (-) Transcript_11521:169-522(-)